MGRGSCLSFSRGWKQLNADPTIMLGCSQPMAVGRNELALQTPENLPSLRKFAPINPML
jgi:hypothetical protein